MFALISGLVLWTVPPAWAESPAAVQAVSTVALIPGSANAAEPAATLATGRQPVQALPLTGDPAPAFGLANENVWSAANIIVLVFLLSGVVWQLTRRRPM